MNFLNYKPEVLAMIQPPALPGSYLNKGEKLNEIIEYVLNEAKILKEIGFDGFILQNMHDGPISQEARPETIAYMTKIGMALRNNYVDSTLGILVNWDGVAGLVVADAINADFVRVEHLYTGVSISTVGFMEGQCIKILETKKRINSSIPVYADVQEVNSNYLCPNDKVTDAVNIIKTAYADGLFLSGKNTNESLEYIKKVKEELPNVPVFLGGGATGENIEELLKYYDGVSVATWIKDGNMRNPINPSKAKQFIESSLKAIEWRKTNIK